ncbi:hypothetical protein L6164_000194 [Bauhinia variegata]|uniref:Uncharacterized protein n=1 Tax=Bauhinia variegata TaxID=167791 RepID=A0ACB9Q608_BAUVA|nr:hypothetical protein L6164_000194 [Bauhinia variegata]
MYTVKTVLPKSAFVCASTSVSPNRELHMSFDEGKESDSEEYNHFKDGILSENNIFNNVNGVLGSDDSLEILSKKERNRRRKIGLANKGRVPWNKGRKHTAETRARIRQRTLEALRDPKVRKRMAEHPRPHSDHVKEKISSSLRHVWQERLKPKQLKEQFMLFWALSLANAARKGGIGQEELDWDSYDKIKQQLAHQELLRAKKKKIKKNRAGANKFMKSWAESIAKAAKKGGSGEQELDWDSYDKIKQEILLHHQLQCVAEKAKAKEIARMRAEKAAQIKAIKKVMLTQRKKEHKERTKERGDPKTKLSKAKEDESGLEVVQEVKLNQRLTKIHLRKSVNGEEASRGDAFNSNFPTVKGLDLELIKREKQRKEVSLADQIRAARIKKATSIVAKSASASDYSSA